MDLLSLVLSLKWLPGEQDGATAPAWWGRATQALFLDVVRQADPEMAETLHTGTGPRPFTVSTLMGRFPQRRLSPDETYLVRLTTLQAPLARLLLQAEETGRLAPGSLVELDYQRFRIEQVDWSEGVWSGTGDYADIAAENLANASPDGRRISLRFTSPTTFKSGGKHVPFPLPELVFGSLLEKWNSFASLAFPADARRYAAECLAVSRYRLKSRVVPQKGGGLRMGAVGEITYVSVNYDRYWMGIMAALAAFARFSGVGVGAATGMGQTRRARE